MLSNDVSDPVPLPRLPSDVHLKIGLWLLDYRSFFSFLDALGTPRARGPFFDRLWQLGLLPKERTNLWPTLVLTHQVYRNPERLVLVEQVMKYMPHILVKTRCDLEWLQQSLGPSTTITWCAQFPSSSTETPVHGILLPLEDWFHLWSYFPISNIVVKNIPDYDEYDIDEIAFDLKPVAEPYFYAMLLRCDRSARLHFKGRPYLALLFQFAATSTTLVM
ncbi:Aste57867_10006 [Aphanomyces stellatus]|uniref:Aste57867_10006 protein n=1 Tax=Aphanomyces stellatus TaxID=120398 RepID=A0A485KPA2_9STRA|nr:hypothetical protein As57867_009967 [Aphanomyces stellatus]VFT86884.1 Aste57867_10006 [Aphanomyces stellatus]